MSDTAPSSKSRLKIVLLTILAVLVLVLIFQNTESVNTRLLFTTVSMPRALLLFTTLAVGFVVGFVVGAVRRRSREGAAR